jgi:hypothetical protein
MDRKAPMTMIRPAVSAAFRSAAALLARLRDRRSRSGWPAPVSTAARCLAATPPVRPRWRLPRGLGSLSTTAWLIVGALALAGLVYAVTAGPAATQGNPGGAPGRGNPGSNEPNASFVSAETNDPPGTIDPGHDKNVADCVVTAITDDQVDVTLVNAYPSYECIITVKIEGTEGHISQVEILEPDPEDPDPPWLDVEELSDLATTPLEPDEPVKGTFRVHVLQEAPQLAVLTFKIKLTVVVIEIVGGSPGFWGNWDSHQTYTKEQIDEWLEQINAISNWYGPDGANVLNTDDMEAVFDAGVGPGSTPESRFLRHCLPVYLNLKALRLSPVTTHDVTGIDPDNFLGLDEPTASTIPEIMDAIEDKFPPPDPTAQQFQIMRRICEALYSLEI